MSKKPIDFSGLVFGYLTVKKFAGKKNGSRYWSAVCICGKELCISVSNLRNAKSCGCKNEGRHGLKNLHKRAYSSWQSMLARTRYKNRDSSEWYMEKGISVCERWVDSFPNFFEDMGDPPDGYSLDRIDSSKGYCKDNCRWATDKEQASNRTSSNIFSYEGRLLTTTQLSSETGVARTTIQRHIALGAVESLIPGAQLVVKGTKKPARTSRRYDRSLNDSACAGCRHAGSGERYVAEQSAKGAT